MEEEAKEEDVFRSLGEVDVAPPSVDLRTTGGGRAIYCTASSVSDTDRLTSSSHSQHTLKYED